MKTYDYNAIKVFLSKDEYLNNTLAVLMFTEDGDLFNMATVNLCHPLQSDSIAFLDENNLPGVGRWMEEKRPWIPEVL